MARAIGVEVVKLSADEVELLAPLEPNHNHMGTAFGGSLGAMLILACYGWFFNRLGEAGKSCHVVIKSGQTDYLKPVTGALRSRCRFVATEEVALALRQFERKGSARLELESCVVGEGDEVLCRFRGEFVARRGDS